MVPLKLRLAHFLSYHEPVEIDFSTIHLACISGLNGAGKSSILEGITWALFGESRCKVGEDIINKQSLKQRKSSEAEVQLIFLVQQQKYRIIRKRQPKKAFLEFHIEVEPEKWKPLTESTLQETQAKIKSLLCMSYETFINASFFLQGKADEFTLKTPYKRKEVLSELLGVQQWDRYKEIVKLKNRHVQGALENEDSALKRDRQKLEELPLLQQKLAEIEQQIREATFQRMQIEERLQERQQLETSFFEQLDLVSKQILETQKDLSQQQQLQQNNLKKQNQYKNLLTNEALIRKEYTHFQALEEELSSLQEKANHYQQLQEQKRPIERELEKKRQALQQKIQILEEQEKQFLAGQKEKQQFEKQLPDLKKQRNTLEQEFETLEKERELCAAYLGKIQLLKTQQQQSFSEREKREKRRLQLQEQNEGTCPLCAQTLHEDHRRQVLETLNQEENALLEQEHQQTEELRRSCPPQLKFPQPLDLNFLSVLTEREIARFKTQWSLLQTQQGKLDQKIATLQERLTKILEFSKQWDTQSKEELQQYRQQIASSHLDPTLEKQMAELKKQEEQLAYSAEKHLQLQQERKKKAPIQQQFFELQQAQEVFQHLEEQTQQMTLQIQEKEEKIKQLTLEKNKVEQKKSSFPPLTQMKSALAQKRLQEDQLKEQSGALKNKQEECLRLQEQLQTQQKILNEKRILLKRLELLEKACGRDGIQALLIEQAIPELEEYANELLARLTQGEMQIFFETQRDLKTRAEQKETLDIKIVDSSGERPYENFSGGEQFRINFAIRLALSKLLASRAGVQLQTLVIDEGFGSQDPQGVQLLIEAINTIQEEFACILVITHMEELRDCFPSQFFVEKGANGSSVALL